MAEIATADKADQLTIVRAQVQGGAQNQRMMAAQSAQMEAQLKALPFAQQGDKAGFMAVWEGMDFGDGPKPSGDDLGGMYDEIRGVLAKDAG